MDVGVRELKQHLSEYLDRAERGEIITVTEHGRPKVQIGRLADRGALDVGVHEGWLRPPATPPTSPVRRRATSRQRVLDELNDDRDE
jgi:antitoxin (DNA-binding transcriptional repressor) of toxin-antitoxin stability system